MGICVKEVRHMRFMAVIFVVFLAFPCIGSAQMISNDDLDRQYGRGASAATRHESVNELDASRSSASQNQAGCAVVNYQSYDDTVLVNTRGTFYGESAGNSTSGTVEGGGTARVKQATYLTITVKNNSASRKVFNLRDVKVQTAKGNVVSPTQSGPKYLQPSETITVSAIKFAPAISAVADVTVSCYGY